MTIWNKYKKIKEISSNENIKTYQAKFEPIIKEISPKDKYEYNIILSNLQNYKEQIYDLIEENNKIYIVLLNDINLDDINIIKEGAIRDYGPIAKKEVNEIFNMEKAMCKIKSFNIDNNCIRYGSGFFIKLNQDRIGLLTNNHVINDIDIDNTININYLSKDIKLNLNGKRKLYTNKKLDYTFIEIFPEDNIQGAFSIYNPKDISKLKGKDIFVLQYPNYDELSL